jgi:excisionase family DNA binding protein
VAEPVAISTRLEYLNLKQAAEFFGVSIWTIRGLIESKRLVAKRIGKYFVVRRVDIDACWEKAA